MNRFCKFKSDVDTGTGLATFNIQIPGTFLGLNSASGSGSYSGRAIQSVAMFSENPLPGDALTSFTIEDTDGVIPVPARAAFLNYPIVYSWVDPGLATDNQGAYFGKDGTILFIPPEGSKIPSQLYLKAIFTKAALTTADTIYGTILWDDLSS